MIKELITLKNFASLEDFFIILHKDKTIVYVYKYISLRLNYIWVNMHIDLFFVLFELNEYWEPRDVKNLSNKQ